MSAALKLDASQAVLQQQEADRRRHLEIVPTRAQKRARPRLILAVSAMAGVVAILLAQLGLSIAVADGAYTISTLQIQQRDLGRQSEALAEKLESLRSPQYLALNAEALGMVASGSLPYIDLATGEIHGKSTKPGGSILRGGTGIANTTIQGLGIVGPNDDGVALGSDEPAVTEEEPVTNEPAPSTGGGLVLDPGLHVVGGGSSGTQSGVATGPGSSSNVSSSADAGTPGTVLIPSPRVR